MQLVPAALPPGAYTCTQTICSHGRWVGGGVHVCLFPPAPLFTSTPFPFCLSNLNISFSVFSEIVSGSHPFCYFTRSSPHLLGFYLKTKVRKSCSFCCRVFSYCSGENSQRGGCLEDRRVQLKGVWWWRFSPGWLIRYFPPHIPG